MDLTTKQRKINFIEALVNASESKSVNDAVLEWAVIHVFEPTDEEKCICGNTNPVYYTIINIANRNKMNLGFECLSKHLPLLKNFATLLCKQFTYQKTTKVLPVKRMCSNCYRHTIASDEPIWKSICKGCFVNGTKTADPIPMLGYRVCDGCLIPNIDPNSESYKTTCHLCYKKSKIILNENECRACVTCGVKNIPLTEPDFKINCIGCVKINKPKEIEDENNRQCVVCEKFNIKPSSADYIDRCLPCYKEGKKSEQEVRNCIVCEKPKLTTKDPLWKQKCNSCFSLTKNESKISEMRQCVGCNLINISADKPTFIKFCPKCFIQKNAPTSGSIPDICLDLSNMDFMTKIIGKK